MDIENAIEDIKLRKISSLDGSPLYSTMDEKRTAHTLPEIDIPAYPTAKPYKNNSIKRMWARARYFIALLRQRMSGRDYPLIVVMVVNNKCNWDCVYCFGDYPNRREIDYTTDQIKYLVDRLYTMGVRYINMHGGETLLRNDVGELCNYIKNKGMYLCLITNGSLLSKKIDEVKNVDNITISLDGGKESNDVNRGQGSFDKTLAAIELVKKYKIPLRISATLTKDSMPDIGYMAKLAQDMGFHLYYSLLFKPLKKAQHLQMTDHEIRQTISDILKYKEMGYPIFTSTRALKAANSWPYDYNERHHLTEDEIPERYREHHIECFYSRTKFTIEADGYIYPCFLTTDGSFKPINWKQHGVEAAIKHVQSTNRCVACPAFSQNDHSLLLGLNTKQVFYVLVDQLKESMGIKNKVKPTVHQLKSPPKVLNLSENSP